MTAALHDSRRTGRAWRAAAQPVWSRPLALQALAVAGAAAVLVAWWHDTPAIQGLGDWLTDAGRVTGLLAGYVIVLLLALMSRAPFLENGIGSDRLARWHASGGRYVVCLVVAHAGLITWGYAVTAHAGILSQTSSLLTSYPDVLMATVAGGLLVVVGTVSARAARRRLRYETWYLLHLYTYLAVALAFSHQFSTGADFVDSRPARIVWSAMYVVVALLLVTYRLLVPLRLAVQQQARVATVVRENPDVVSLVLRGERLTRMHAQPGQFVRCRFLTRNGWWQSHPFSLSALPGGDRLRITVKRLGDHSGELQTVAPGTRVLLEGPYGSFTAARRRHRGVLLVAGGVGVTPIRALFEQLAAPEVTVVIRANRPEELLFPAEFDRIADAHGSTVHSLCGPPGGPSDVLVGDRLRDLVPDLAERDVYVCGPPAFMAVAETQLRRLGVARAHLHAEQFSF